MPESQGKIKQLAPHLIEARSYTDSMYAMDNAKIDFIAAKMYIKLDLTSNIVISKLNADYQELNVIVKSLIEHLKDYSDSNTVGMFNCTAGIITNFATMSPQISIIPEFDISKQTEKFTLDNVNDLISNFISACLNEFVIPYDLDDATVVLRGLPTFEVDIPTIKFSPFHINVPIEQYINESANRQNSMNLTNIHEKINCKTLQLLDSTSIKSGVLNLLKIPSLKSLHTSANTSKTLPWFDIISEHLDDKNINAAQTKLFKSGLKEYARY